MAHWTDSWLRRRWCEHDPLEIWESVRACIDGALEAAREAVGEVRVVALGLTNQRETTLVWDRVTGRSLHNAIVWHDGRTAAICNRVSKDVGKVLPRSRQDPRLHPISPSNVDDGGPLCRSGRVSSEASAAPVRIAHRRAAGGARAQDHFRPVTGLPVSTYFSAYKWRWLVEEVPAVAEAAREGRCMLGTVDAWLLYRLTGGVDGAERTARDHRPGVTVLLQAVHQQTRTTLHLE